MFTVLFRLLHFFELQSGEVEFSQQSLFLAYSKDLSLTSPTGIDQENIAPKILEIRLQAGIFNRAARVFVWLRQPKSTVQTSLEAIDDMKERMSNTMKVISRSGEESTYLEYIAADSTAWTATITALEGFFVDR